MNLDQQSVAQRAFIKRYKARGVELAEAEWDVLYES